MRRICRIWPFSTMTVVETGEKPGSSVLPARASSSAAERVCSGWEMSEASTKVKSFASGSVSRPAS